MKNRFCKIILGMSAAVSVSACSSGNDQSAENTPPVGTCDLSLADKVGEPIANYSVPQTALYRVIAPGTAVTKDYRLERTNIDIDDNGIIQRVYCG